MEQPLAAPFFMGLGVAFKEVDGLGHQAQIVGIVIEGMDDIAVKEGVAGPGVEDPGVRAPPGKGVSQGIRQGRLGGVPDDENALWTDSGHGGRIGSGINRYLFKGQMDLLNLI